MLRTAAPVTGMRLVRADTVPEVSAKNGTRPGQDASRSTGWSVAYQSRENAAQSRSGTACRNAATPSSASNPCARPNRVAAGSLAVAVLVELFRLVHAPGLDAFRLTATGALLLGRVFSPWNVLAYAAGIAAAWALHRRRGEPPAPAPAV